MTSVFIRFIKIYKDIMLPLIRELARYRPIIIEARHRRWWVACEVRLPAGVMSGIVKASGEKLYPALKNLIPLVKEEERILWEKFRAPKQQEFQYGAGSGWKEIV